MSNRQHPDQAPDANRAPGQETPSRSYGRQVHSEAAHDADAATAQSTPTHANGQADGDAQQRTGSPSEATA